LRLPKENKKIGVFGQTLFMFCCFTASDSLVAIIGLVFPRSATAATTMMRSATTVTTRQK